ncbi:hypothetical protein BDP27DRAFT_1367329 [Rhodocollybia butyracea]|uniref:Uncharacterized protein n=1 Tax=Rhodocollybia butyracea TaxID=206335 RepID=A0A9P5PJ94_9AGAR|nr:hypothetical protein BDP27DRAFT_1367329 [Rhodocollybia butyracea]
MRGKQEIVGYEVSKTRHQQFVPSPITAKLELVGGRHFFYKPQLFRPVVITVQSPCWMSQVVSRSGGAHRETEIILLAQIPNPTVALHVEESYTGCTYGVYLTAHFLLSCHDLRALELGSHKVVSEAELLFQRNYSRILCERLMVEAVWDECNVSFISKQVSKSSVSDDALGSPPSKELMSGPA